MTNLEKHRMKMLSKLLKRGAPQSRIERAMRAYEKIQETEVAAEEPKRAAKTNRRVI